MNPIMHRWLEIARARLEEEGLPPAERDCLLQLLDVLSRSLDNLPLDLQAETSSLADHLLNNHRLLSLLRQQTAELDALRKLSLNLTSSLDLTTVLNAVATEAMRLLPDAQDTHIYLYTEGRLIFGAALDAKGNRRPMWSEPRPNGLTYTVARSGQMIVVEDMRHHPLFKGTPPDWVGSIVGIPLKMGTRVVGVMNIARYRPGPFSDSDLRLMRLLADQAAIAIVNARLHEAVSRQALTDMVTGLPNRRALDDRLDRSLRAAQASGRPFAVIMMDLDGFKQINDTYGHDMGDRLLSAAFGHLAQGLRGNDFVARYGGDELTLVLDETDLPHALIVAQKVQEKLTGFVFPLPDDRLARLQISGGVAVFPQHGQTASELLRAADEALYLAKRHARGTVQIARERTD